MNTGEEPARLRNKIIQTLIKLRSEGKNIYGGMFYGYNPAEVQLSCTKHIDGSTSVTYSYYSKMWQFLISEAELSKPEDTHDSRTEKRV